MLFVSAGEYVRNSIIVVLSLNDFLEEVFFSCFCECKCASQIKKMNAFEWKITRVIGFSELNLNKTKD